VAELKVTSVLLRYEMPLLVLAQDARDRPFVGVNYGDGDQSHLFYFARVLPDSLQKLNDLNVDVRYLVTRLRRGPFEMGETWGEPLTLVKTRRSNSIKEEWLPDTGMFVSLNHVLATAGQERTVHIDGRWGIDDLRRFSDLVQDSYAFVFALSGLGGAKSKNAIQSLFRRYPWRGGFSSVNFFDDLYRLIPSPQRASITRIQYASPGTIDLRMNDEVAIALRGIVARINDGENEPFAVYQEVRKNLQERGWLGKAKGDLRLTTEDNALLLQHFKILCGAFNLSTRESDILALASSDPLSAVKILLAYYRRVAALADYVATGKAQDIFAASASMPKEESQPT
jgi:hypothetical protein